MIGREKNITKRVQNKNILSNRREKNLKRFACSFAPEDLLSLSIERLGHFRFVKMMPVQPHSEGLMGPNQPAQVDPSAGENTGQIQQPTISKDPMMNPGDFVPKNPVQSRDYVYRLIISQLFYDGYQQMASQMTNMLHPDPPCPPSDRLFNVVMLGLEREAEIVEEKRRLSKEKALMSSNPVRGLMTDLGPGMDLEFETDVDVNAPEPALYETAYVTSHKGSCRAGAFSRDGALCATGSVDASIKVLDVDRMLAKSSKDLLLQTQPHLQREADLMSAGHPVIRTLYDHFEEVTCLKFHPKQNILASGSRDCTIKLFDYSKVSAKKAVGRICDASHIESIAFHPSGDHLLVGVMQPVTRIYDVNTGQCFVASNPIHQHQGSVVSVDWSSDGKRYVTASLDGSIKVWDGVSSNCITTFAQSHDGAEVASVQFTRNGESAINFTQNTAKKYLNSREVYFVFWSRLAREIVGIVDNSLLNRLHWSWCNRETSKFDFYRIKVLKNTPNVCIYRSFSLKLALTTPKTSSCFPTKQRLHCAAGTREVLQEDSFFPLVTTVAFGTLFTHPLPVHFSLVQTISGPDFG